LTGCSGEGGFEAVGSQSEALTTLATATALQRGTRHDYNGDGKEDLIFYDGTGSHLYLGLAPSGFAADSWVRNDLTSNNTSYAAGDYNGDGKSDLLIVNPSGVYEYTGRSDGSFNGDAWTSAAFTYANVAITVGDFNGDLKSDFIATTSSGSYLYTGKSTGGFNANVWSNTALKLGVVQLTAGNFNSDAATDFISTSANGSWEYTGKTTGGFNANVWSNSSINTATQGCRFSVGNFDGTGPDDFIVSTASGGYLYLGKSTGGFNASWSSPDFPVNNSPILGGNFDGAAGMDIIEQVAGSFHGAVERIWLNGDWSSSLWVDQRYDNSYDAALFRGDFNGDGMDDLLSMTRTNSPISEGTHEHTGKYGGSFNSDVWIAPDIYADTMTPY